jgi:hypothetical protein
VNEQDAPKNRAAAGKLQRKKKLADKTSEEKPVTGKVLQFRRPLRANPRPRRPGARGAKPPTQLVVSVQLILSRMGLCGAD